MENDLISKNALLVDIRESVVFSGRSGETSAEMRGAHKVTDRVKVAPTIDAVEVVRCKKCDWYREEDETCGFWPDEGYRDPNHFCSEGKRRTDV